MSTQSVRQPTPLKKYFKIATMQRRTLGAFAAILLLAWVGLLLTQPKITSERLPLQSSQQQEQQPQQQQLVKHLRQQEQGGNFAVFVVGGGVVRGDLENDSSRHEVISSSGVSTCYRTNIRTYHVSVPLSEALAVQ